MKPKYIIIHHTATDRDHTTFEAVKKYHISKGYGNIGYHFLITADGVLHGYPEARGQDIVGAHCRADGMNYKSIGICLTGNFEKQQPIEKQLSTLRNLVDQLKKEWNIPTENVLGHKEVKGAKTVCPGTHLTTFIKTIRKIDGYNESEATKELLRTIKELRVANGQLKQKNTKLMTKLTNAKNIIKELKVAIQSKKTWADKLLELIKKNEND